MTQVHSNKIDDILTGITPKPPEIKAEPLEDQEVNAPTENNDLPEPVKEIAPSEGVDEKTLEQKAEEKTPEVKAEEEHTDEYGNPTEKPRVYTEEEVQRIVRDRLTRVHASKSEQQQVEKAAENFKADPNSGEDWEVQLKSFIKNTLNEVQTEKSTQEWKQQEQRKQQDFEEKFTMGMNKYKDFNAVVGKMPITNSIMVATREMSDPAAFLYAASKLHPEELKNIAAMGDPFTQARELGRLDERMKKARAISNAPAPLTKTKGDMSAKYVPKQSIDDKIHQHAKARRR